MRRFGVVFPSVLFAGCSVITDVDSLRTGKDTDAMSMSMPDAQTQDAPIADAGADTMMMMQGDADAGSLGFCASQSVQPKLCEDFDTGLFSAKFSSVHQTGGTVAASSSAFKSSPNALLSQVPMSGTNVGSAYLQKIFVGNGSSFTFSFDFRAEAWVTGGKSCVIGGIRIDDGKPTEHTLNLYITDTYAAVEEIYIVNNVNQFVDHTLSSHPLLGQWSHFVITLDAVNRTAKVELDGNVVLGTTNLHSSWAPGVPACNLGITYVASTMTPWAMRYDNAIFDFN